MQARNSKFLFDAELNRLVNPIGLIGLRHYPEHSVDKTTIGLQNPLNLTENVLETLLKREGTTPPTLLACSKSIFNVFLVLLDDLLR